MGKRQVLCCFIFFSIFYVPILGAPSSSNARNSCVQRQLNKMVPWHQRYQVTNGSFDILNLKRPQYRKEFKNPCWYEETDDGSQLRCLPYFFIVAMPKAGSTDLWARIAQHPNVSTDLLIKEPHWWAVWRYHMKERRSIDYYINIFQQTAQLIKRREFENNGEKFYPMVTGEGSPDTLWKMKHFKSIPQNCPSDLEPTVVNAHMIKHLIPNAKILVTLRNPVEHLFAMYLFFGKEKKSSRGFHNLCLSEISRWNNCIKDSTWRQCAYNMTEPGWLQERFRATIYVVFLRDWLEVFPREQIYVSQLEEYGKNELKAVNNIFKFLELGEFTTPKVELPVQNPRTKNAHVKMLEKTSRLLEDFYKPYNQALSQLLKDDKWLYKSN